MKNNNHLLKPYTNYAIDKNNNYIIIDGEKYRYEMDTLKLGLDPDGDAIRTCKDVNFVTRFPIIGVGDGYETELKVRNKIPL